MVSFIGGGNCRTRKNPPTYRNSQTDKLYVLVVIGTDCICSCKSNYHTITTMTAPLMFIDIHIISNYMYM